MVAKCANLECNKKFQELHKGRLFLLPPSAAVPRLIDYCYWLCPECASKYTIERVGGQFGISVLPRSAPIRPNTLQLQRRA